MRDAQKSRFSTETTRMSIDPTTPLASPLPASLRGPTPLSPTHAHAHTFKVSSSPLFQARHAPIGRNGGYPMSVLSLASAPEMGEEGNLSPSVMVRSQIFLHFFFFNWTSQISQLHRPDLSIKEHVFSILLYDDLHVARNTFLKCENKL